MLHSSLVGVNIKLLISCDVTPVRFGELEPIILAIKRTAEIKCLQSRIGLRNGRAYHRDSVILRHERLEARRQYPCEVVFEVFTSGISEFCYSVFTRTT
jgi:hypothetical protein